MAKVVQEYTENIDAKNCIAKLTLAMEHWQSTYDRIHNNGTMSARCELLCNYTPKMESI